MKLIEMADRIRYTRMATAERRATFLLEAFFKLDTVELAYIDLDRTVVGSAVLIDSPLSLETDCELKPAYFCERRELGILNRRTIYKPIHREGLRSAQLVMGFTLLDPGSNWNTMSPHTHMRPSEIYSSFGMDPAHRVVHLMGPTDETSHFSVANREIVFSPGWSIHSRAGTSSYTFCWGTGGENQDYDDRNRATIAALKRRGPTVPSTSATL